MKNLQVPDNFEAGTGLNISNSKVECMFKTATAVTHMDIAVQMNMMSALNDAIAYNTNQGTSNMTRRGKPADCLLFPFSVSGIIH